MSNTAPESQVQSAEERFEDTPQGWAQRWTKEMKAARDWHSDWQKKGGDIIDRYLDKRSGNLPAGVDTRWNFYTANVQTQEALLYGRTPQVDVRPRFADARDNLARVASELLQRLLNCDIEREGDGFAPALGLCLKDRLNPGAAVMRFRYVADFEKVEGKKPQLDEATGAELAPAVPAREKKSNEDVESDYIHWRDVMWSPCRTWHEMRFIAFRAQLSFAEKVKKFGELIARELPVTSQKESANSTDAKKADPWGRTDVWEIWDKDNHCTWFWVEGYKAVLTPVDLKESANPNGSLEDPLGLDGFFPCQEPMLANLTTSAFLPRADYTLYEDLYNEIDRVSTRITEIERAVGVKGLYNKNAGDSVARLLTEESNGKLLPVENWEAFAEKNGIRGAVDWFPIEATVAALDKLREYRGELVQSLYQLTGMSDIMRGESSDVDVTAAEQQIKAKFASVRLQHIQERFARFAAEGQRIRAEIACKHFEARTIFDRANFATTFDAEDAPQEAQQAVELLKSKYGLWRVDVKPESISVQDFAALKSEKMEVITAIGGFMQQAVPLLQMMPGSLPFLLELLEALVASMRGGAELGGILQRAAQAAQQQSAQQGGQPQQQQQDPKLATVQAKTQGDIAKIQAQTQSELMRQQAETQQLAQREEHAAQVNVQEEVAKQRIRHMGNVAAAALQPPGGTGGGP